MDRLARLATAASISRPRPDGFVLVIMVTVAVASVVPAHGKFAVAAGWLSAISITLLFFLNGARLTREAILLGLVHWRLHLAIMSLTYLLFPFLALSAEAVFPHFLPAKLWLGVLFLAVLPSTIQSSIAFTTIARGNVAGAVTAAAFSNIAGLALTPLLLTLLAGTRAAAPSPSAIGRILGELFVPFVLGHLMRPTLAGWIANHGRLITLNDRGTILIAVYTAFSASVIGGLWHLVSPSALARLALICVALLALILVASSVLARLFGFSRPDRVALMFCGSKKTLASGVPMARMLFPSADGGLILLPIMIYHQVQLMVCAAIAAQLARATDGPVASPRAAGALQPPSLGELS